MAGPARGAVLLLQIDCVLADYRKKATGTWCSNSRELHGDEVDESRPTGGGCGCGGAGIQAAVVAPSTVKVLEFPDKIPDFDPDTTLVVRRQQLQRGTDHQGRGCCGGVSRAAGLTVGP